MPRACSSARKAALLRSRAKYSISNECPKLFKRRAMHSMGVMPMPPATSTECVAVSSSAKWLRGSEMVMGMPTRSDSCTQREPPRLARSRSTPTT